MANRHTLHFTHADEFKQWLISDGWEIEEPKGCYERIRARKGKRIFLAYEKAEAKEHYSVSDRDSGVVGAFYRDRASHEA